MGARRSARYLALLRGINVGGNNRIPMADLRDCFESGSFEDVRTYIASGNVLFRSGGEDAAGLTRRIEAMLSSTFGYDATVLILGHRQLRAVVKGAPKGFGAHPDELHSDVIFLLPPLTPSEAVEQLEPREGVDEVHLGPDALYFTRLSARLSQSRLSKIVGKPIYKRMTIRTWRTTTKLLTLMDEAG